MLHALSTVCLPWLITAATSSVCSLLGLTLTSCGRLLTVDTKRKSILLFEPDGKNYEEHRFEPSYTSDKRSKVRFLAAHRNKLVVSDLGR